MTALETAHPERRAQAPFSGLRASAVRLTAAAALASVVSGAGFAAVGLHQPADALWAATTALLLVPLTSSVLRSLLHHDVGVDAIALVSMPARSSSASTSREPWSRSCSPAPTRWRRRRTAALGAS